MDDFPFKSHIVSQIAVHEYMSHIHIPCNQ
uniref:Uncharacterized protein n=1 Tax=Anguilla anguilla TaxID=7936 RepID=A0A0E9UKJ7_ANGAN